MTSNENREHYAKARGSPTCEQEAPLTTEIWTVMFEKAGGENADMGLWKVWGISDLAKSSCSKD